jgi:hypothetical protein
MTPPPPALKIHTFLDSKHLHSAWIADAASFRGASVSRPIAFIRAHFSILAFDNFSIHIPNYFQQRSQNDAGQGVPVTHFYAYFP